MTGERGIWDILLLQDYNTVIVVMGASLLGLAGGFAGTLLLLRKRALLGDVVSHATLPGVVAAFMVMQAFGGGGKHLVGLLIGAAITGLAAAWIVPALRKATGLKDDAIMGIVLGSAFGLGISLLAITQGLPGGNQAGLDSFIYGKTASMVRDDAMLIGIGAIVVIAVSLLLCKEFRLLCFDEAFGSSLGRPMLMLDGLLMLVAVGVIVIGLQAVGLILMIALLIIPASSARFWTDGFVATMIVAGGLGAASGWVGSTISAMAARLPAGAIIVLAAGGFFLLSLLLGTRRGLVRRIWRQIALRIRVQRQHLLRAMHEAVPEAGSVDESQLLRHRTWTPHRLAGALRRALRRGEIESTGTKAWRLTPHGLVGARQIVRNHRLWELFLIHYADIAPSHVDRDADMVEHVLDAALVAELEALVVPEGDMPQSPHPLGGQST